MGLVSISIRPHFLAFNGFPSQLPGPVPDTTMTPHRRRLLFTFATVIFSMMQKVLQRMHVPTQPTGKTAKVLHGIEHHWLTILSFFDDHVMVIEYLIEAVCPSSTRVFDKIDGMVKGLESLPVKFDDFFDHDVPSFMQRVPFLDRVFKKDEKEIVIDITCHGYRREHENSFECENVKRDVENEKCGHDNVADTSKTDGNLRLKEAIDDINKETENMEDASGEFLYSGRTTSSTDEIYQSGIREDPDPIFDLFEAGWHMSPRALSSTSST
ncbi:hypothetical protein SSX86_017379 [Deinandra increscens subsp. villosa]|uniref:Uncharacterized protein n=1 Tax=Deinandra increscens subsp. villosa TaxID=3103831 RepID=A0AAP0GWQ0_9ASTR